MIKGVSILVLSEAALIFVYILAYGNVYKMDYSPFLAPHLRIQLCIYNIFYFSKIAQYNLPFYAITLHNTVQYMRDQNQTLLVVIASFPSYNNDIQKRPFCYENYSYDPVSGYDHPSF